MTAIRKQHNQEFRNIYFSNILAIANIVALEGISEYPTTSYRLL
jgi:hypothetical protein